jgi:hypothetical protein
MYARRTLFRACAILLLAMPLLVETALPAAADAILVIRNSTDPGQSEHEFTDADLLALPQRTVRTRTEFTDGVVEFVGPLARDAIGHFDIAGATSLHLVAANDYSIDIPISDILEYDVILAMEANGKRLSIRDKGPIWLMYPLDDHPELQDAVYNARLIWQLTFIEIR